MRRILKVTENPEPLPSQPHGLRYATPSLPLHIPVGDGSEVKAERYAVS